MSMKSDGRRFVVIGVIPVVIMSLLFVRVRITANGEKQTYHSDKREPGGQASLVCCQSASNTIWLRGEISWYKRE